MSLYADIEAMCTTIKHTPETVDLDDVRVLLRRAQGAVAVVDQLALGRVTVSRDVIGDGTREIVATFHGDPATLFDFDR